MLQPDPACAAAHDLRRHLEDNSGPGIFGGIANLGLAAVLVSAGSSIAGKGTMADWYGATIYLVAGGGVISAACLLAGAVMTFTRKRLGPRIVAAGCALCIIVFVNDLAVSIAAANEAKGANSLSTSPIHYFVGLILPIATLAPALLPATKRYCRREQSSHSCTSGIASRGYDHFDQSIEQGVDRCRTCRVLT